MSFQRSFHALSFGTTLWAFLMLAMSGGIEPWQAALWFLAAMVAIGRRVLGWPEATRPWLLASILVFIACLAGFLRGEERFYPVIYLFLFLTLNLLWTAHKDRHWLQLYALGFFLVLGAAVSTTSFLFAPMALVYLLAMIATLVAFTLRRDSAAAFATGRDPRIAASSPEPVPVRVVEGDQRRLERLARSPWLSPRMAQWVLRTGIAIVVVAACVFVVVPRLEAGSLLRGFGPTGKPRRVTGFSDTVDLGAAAAIESDPTIVLRVRLGDRGVTRPEYLRLRGNALDQWDGRRWTRSTRLQADQRELNDTNNVILPAGPVAGMQERRLTFLLEPGISEFLFLPERTTQVDLDRRTTLVLDSFSRALWMRRAPSTLMQYNVRHLTPISSSPEASARTVTTAATPPANLIEAGARTYAALAAGTPLAPARGGNAPRRASLPEDWLAVLTRLPADTATPTVLRMAEEWAQGLDDPQAIAETFERRLRNEFTYTTDVSSFSLEPDHLTRFLRTEQRGHCEYFATAMALMLRARGIPARVASGYLTDEWSESGGGYFIVRQQNAHSWVEAWIDGAGWRTFDPTPPDGVMSGRNPDNFWRALSRWTDGIRVLWYQWVVDFNGGNQRRLFAQVFGHGSLSRTLLAMDRAEVLAQRRLAEVAGRAGGLALVTGGLLGAAALLLFGWHLLRRRGTAPARRRSREGPEAYRRLLKELERRNPRQPAQTPGEFAAAIVSGRPDLADLLALTEAYYAARFHTEAWGREQTERARELLRRLREEPASP